MEFSTFFLLALNFLIFLLIYFNFDKISKIINIYDIPSKRKLHRFKTPLIGGVIVVLIFLLNFFVLTYLNIQDFYNYLSVKNYKFYSLTLILFLVLFLIGLYDDKFDLDNSKKLFWIIFFSIIIVYSNYSFQILNLNFSFGLEFSLEKFSLLFTSICMITLIVIMNLYDGTNLQSGIFYLLNYLLIFLITQSTFILFLFIIPLVFFLFFNFSGKCFLGDSGSNFMSCIFGVILIRFYYNQDEIFADHIFLIVLIPLIDAVRLSAKRLLSSGSPFEADRNHIHHIILTKYSYKKTIFLLSMFPLITFVGILLKIETFFVISGLLIYYFFLIKKN